MTNGTGTTRSGDLLLLLLGVLAAFHLLLILGVLPPDIVWGGRAEETPGGVRAMEAVSLAVTLLMMLVVALREGRVGPPRRGKAIRAALWVMFVYFLLNIAGNLASSSAWEKAVFTPLSAVLAALVLVLALRVD